MSNHNNESLTRNLADEIHYLHGRLRIKSAGGFVCK